MRFHDGHGICRRSSRLAESARCTVEQVIMIGDTMETDIRGAFESGMHGYLVLTGSTQFEDVGDYVYQPTRILQSIAELTDEIRSNNVDPEGKSPAVQHVRSNGSRLGTRHQTDVLALYRPRPRPAMTK